MNKHLGMVVKMEDGTTKRLTVRQTENFNDWLKRHGDIRAGITMLNTLTAEAQWWVIDRAWYRDHDGEPIKRALLPDWEPSRLYR